VNSSTAKLHNNQVIHAEEVPLFREDSFCDALSELLDRKMRICSFFGERMDQDVVKLYAICADDRGGVIRRCIFSSVKYTNRRAAFQRATRGLNRYGSRLHGFTRNVPLRQ